MRTVAITLGVIMMILGFLALILSLVGLKLSFLAFIDSGGRLLGFVIKLMMIVIGIVILALAQTNWNEEMNPGRQLPEEN